MTPRESESCSVMCDSQQAHGLYSPWNFPGQNTGVGSLSLLEGIFPTQGLNPGLPHCRRMLYQLSHKGSPQQHFPKLLPHRASSPPSTVPSSRHFLSVQNFPDSLPMGAPFSFCSFFNYPTDIYWFLFVLQALWIKQCHCSLKCTFLWGEMENKHI